ncbi:MAG: class I SAM-dependent methyltransferase [Methyloligellaceae bacterium]
MQLDVTELRDFYHRPLGIAVRRHLRNVIRQKWNNVHGKRVIGVGFPAPFLGIFKGEAERVGAFMPAEQGVVLWPRKGPYCSALVDEEMLPLADSSVDMCLLVHSVEMSHNVPALLREIWRVLTPEGRLILVVPNRRGVWARVDSTPFGHGRPYSKSQLRVLLQDTMFVPQSWLYMLYMPPLKSGLLLRTMNAWERIGAAGWPIFSGLIMAEASKEIYAASPKSSIKIIPGLAPLPFK